MTAAADTIFAAASGAGRAAIAVVRLSGPDTRRTLDAMAGGPPPARRLTLRTLRHPFSGEELDQALVAWFPAPHSFTGEDQAELHIHGGLAVRRAVLGALAGLSCCRPAEPGEFTRRAFFKGRMDLTNVEGLADLIDAETEAQRRQALRQLEGRLGTQVETWRERLVEALALLEAALDFSDEGDVPETLERDASGIVAALAAELGRALADGGSGERLREGFSVVLAGAPNAGKSTLLNALARRDVAIVTPVAGTTRDVIEVRLDLGGWPVLLADTAGLRETADPVEQEGVTRTRRHARAADLVLWLVAPDEPAGEGRPPETGGRVLKVRTKADLEPGAGGPADGLAVSALTGQGLPDLIERIRAEAERGLVGTDPLVTRERHRAALERAVATLGEVPGHLAAGATELAAEDVRLAARALGAITGRVDVEDVLDRLFASFCIGK